jgi:hypothetical protein
LDSGEQETGTYYSEDLLVTNWMAQVSMDTVEPPCCGLYDAIYGIENHYCSISEEEAQACIDIMLISDMWKLNYLD